MDSWDFTKIDDKKYAGIITAVSPEVTDIGMMDQFQDLEFKPGDRQKVLLVDRKMIFDDGRRFYGVGINEFCQPEWSTYGTTNPGPRVVEKADNIFNELTGVVLTTDDLDFKIDDSAIDQSF